MKPSLASTALAFRPFFLLGGAGAAAMLAWWLLIFRGAVPAPPHYGAADWHAHSMIFGFAAAVIAGFVLTASANWTGRPAARGGRVWLLAGIWLAGRVLPVLPDLAGRILLFCDLFFFVWLARLLLPFLASRAQRRNWWFFLYCILMILAALGYHTGGVAGLPAGPMAMRFALDATLLIVLLIGGRVVPAFSRPVLGGQPAKTWPVLERIAMPLVLAFVLARTLLPFGQTEMLLAWANAFVHGLRLILWFRPAILGRPILWVLYSGWLWMVLGFVLTGLAARGMVSHSVALHTFTVGGLGVLVYAMMSRVSLGHTGRPLNASRLVVAGYILINVSAFCRTLLPTMWPELYLQAVLVAGILWVAAFIIFLVHYIPVLTTPRVDGKPG